MKVKIRYHMCSICIRQTAEPTYGFTETLRSFGITGIKAHVSCIKQRRDQLFKKRKKGLL